VRCLKRRTCFWAFVLKSNLMQLSHNKFLPITENHFDSRFFNRKTKQKFVFTSAGFVGPPTSFLSSSGHSACLPVCHRRLAGSWPDRVWLLWKARARW
jgi:hypothetical protein